MSLHEILHPAVERGLDSRIIDLAVIVAWNREDWDVVMGVRFVELGVIIIFHSGEIDDVSNVIEKLRFAARQSINHLFRDIVLEFTVLNTAGVTGDMKDHLVLLLDGACDIREGVRQLIVIGRQSQRTWQLLKSDVAMTDGIQWADAAVSLRNIASRAPTNLTRLNSAANRGVFGSGGAGHRISSI